MYTTHFFEPLTAKTTIVFGDELRQRRRVSEVPFAKPGQAEFHVIREAAVGTLPLPERGSVALLAPRRG